jgi:putative ABC transport system permease protein
MLRNYLATAWRNIRRNKVYSLIKIAGLAAGIAVCVLIYLFVYDELSFDRFHENGESLYRVLQVGYNRISGVETGRSPFLPPPVGPELERSVSWIKGQTRFTAGQGSVRYEDKVFSESVSLADSAFFEMFTFPLISGSPASALSRSQNIVLTKTKALKYFGADDPLGKIMTLSFGPESRDFLVAGVAEDVPGNSSIRFDFVISFDNLPWALNIPGILNDWSRWYAPLYVQLGGRTAPEDVRDGLERFRARVFGSAEEGRNDSGRDSFRLELQPVKDMYLDRGVAGNAGLSPSLILGGIALAILLIACVNYMNLSVGTSAQRSMEVGMRKVIGARRRQVARQFAAEALLMSGAAVFLGMILAELLLPQFNHLSGKILTMRTFLGGRHILALAAIAVVTGLCAGSYPAFVLSAFKPVDVMKGRLRTGGKARLTRGLVVLQFVLSVILTISAMVMGRQASFLVNRDPGYVREGLVAVLTQENDLQESERIRDLFRAETASDSRILGVTASNREFGLFLPGSRLDLNQRSFQFRFDRVDPAFLSTMKIRLVEGRDFLPSAGADRDAAIVNRKFMEAAGESAALGATIGDASRGFPQGLRIVGVVGDCFFQSMRVENEPLLLYVGRGDSPRRDRFSRLFVRIGTADVRGTMGFLEKTWRKIEPDKPFVSYFQDEALRTLYDRETRWSAIIRFATAVSILLACLGVFGLTSLSLGRRAKEIGIRKVLGARLEQILGLAMKDIVVLVALANVIAWPLVYYILMKGFLGNYPYRVSLGIGYFLLAGAASILIAALTILYLSLRAARTDPVKSLRYE